MVWAETHLKVCKADLTHHQFLVQMLVTASVELRASHFICLMSSDFNNSPLHSMGQKGHMIPCTLSGNSINSLDADSETGPIFNIP